LAKFERGLSPDFVKALKHLADTKSWWQDVLHDDKLLIAIRKEKMNVYWRGQSIFNVGFNKEEGVTVSTHCKYLLDPAASSQAQINPEGTFVLSADPIMHLYEGNKTLQKLKRAAEVYAGDEKIGVHSIVKFNSDVIDVEVAIDARDLPTFRKVPRIDIAALKQRDDYVELVFWEAKLFHNGELRATVFEAEAERPVNANGFEYEQSTEDSLPRVMKQLSEYREALDAYRVDIIRSYTNVAKNLVDIAGMSGSKHKVGATISDVARGNELKIGHTPEVGLLIFGLDADQKAGRIWNEHLNRLRNEGKFPIVQRGSAKGLKL
jgi:hypothetical protein